VAIAPAVETLATLPTQAQALSVSGTFRNPRFEGARLASYRASIKQKLGLRTGAAVGMAALGFVRAQKNSNAERIKPEAAPALSRQEVQ
ncbi:MAG: hypothetical protein ING54_10440, partial [Rhodocyclaceae bacterium]|nr:hypothetical protein [Rhodocyclaceae bacterium]